MQGRKKILLRARQQDHTLFLEGTRKGQVHFVRRIYHPVEVSTGNNRAHGDEDWQESGVVALGPERNCDARACLGACDCPLGCVPPTGPSTIHNVSPSWHPHVFFTICRPAARHGSTRRAGEKTNFLKCKKGLAVGWVYARGQHQNLSSRPRHGSGVPEDVCNKDNTEIYVLFTTTPIAPDSKLKAPVKSVCASEPVTNTRCLSARQERQWLDPRIQELQAPTLSAKATKKQAAKGKVRVLLDHNVHAKMVCLNR